MPPTRKYMSKTRDNNLNIFGVLIGLLFVLALLGGLIWVNLEIWNTIF